MSNVIQAIRTADTLTQALETMKRVNGDKWPEKSKPYRDIIVDLMRKTGNDNALSVVIPVAKEVAAAGDSPLMLLAVAAEMSMEKTGNPA